MDSKGWVVIGAVGGLVLTVAIVLGYKIAINPQQGIFVFTPPSNLNPITATPDINLPINNNTKKCLGFDSSNSRKNYIANKNNYSSFYIVNTYENSYYAGLRQGDLIMTANNMPISNVSDLPSLSASLPVGSIVTIVIARPSSYILFPDYSYKFSYPVSLYALQIPITNNCSS